MNSHLPSWESHVICHSLTLLFNGIFFLSTLNHTFPPSKKLLPSAATLSSAPCHSQTWRCSAHFINFSTFFFQHPHHQSTEPAFSKVFNISHAKTLQCPCVTSWHVLFTPILLRFFPRLPDTTVCWDSSYLLPSQSQTPFFLLNPRQHPRTAVPYIWYTLLDGLINPHGSHYHSWPTHVSLFSPCELQMHVFILITHWMAQVLKLNMSVQSLTWSKLYFYTSCKISVFCTKPFNVYPPCSM